MTMQFIQGFEQYETATALLASDYFSFMGFQPIEAASSFDIDIANNRVHVIDTDARVDGKSLRIRRIGETNPGTHYAEDVNMVTKIALTGQSKIVMGVGLKHGGSYDTAAPLIVFGNDAGLGLETHFSLWVSPVGSLSLVGNEVNVLTVDRGTPKTLLNVTAPGTVNMNEWQYIEVGCDYSTVPNTVEVRVNGVPVIVAQNTSFSNSSIAADVNVVGIVTPKVTFVTPEPIDTEEITTFIDDIYVLDGTGVVSNDFLGAHQARFLPIDGAGSSAQWTPNGAPTNYQSVEGAFFDPADTSFVSASISGLIDYYTVQDSPADVAGIAAVKLGVFARTTAGASNLQLKSRNGVDEQTGNILVASGSYVDVGVIFDTAPDGSAWTKLALDSLEFGLENL